MDAKKLVSFLGHNSIPKFRHFSGEFNAEKTAHRYQDAFIVHRQAVQALLQPKAS